MNIPKAIEILIEDVSHPTAQFMPELQEAEKLGIEALKAIRDSRASHSHSKIWVLPGETKE